MRALLQQARVDLLLGAALFAVALAVFAASPIRTAGDSQYSMLLSEQLLTRGTFALDEHFKPPLDMDRYPGVNGTRGAYPYQIETVRSHQYYYFPIGSSVLSVPLVAVLRVFDVSTIEPDGSYRYSGEVTMQAAIAAFLMAALAVIFFATARLVLPRAPSFAAGVTAAFGTQLWSTASRALWSDTWGIFLLGGAVWLLLAHETGKSRMRPVLLATLLSWTYIVRPTNAMSILAVTLWVAWCARKSFIAYAATGAAWFFAFVTYSELHFARPLPTYYAERWLTFERFWKPLAAHLVSPGRGLFVYVPVAAFAVYLLVRYRRTIPHRRLLPIAGVAIAGHLIVISGFSMWYAGVAYGPRYMTGILPWLVLLGILGLGARADAGAKGRLEPAFGIALAALSIAIQSRGGFAPSVWKWNSEPPVEIYADQKIWNWRAPQFAAGFVDAGISDAPPLYSFGTDLKFDQPESDPFLKRGFSKREQGFRWTEGNEAELAFSAYSVPGHVALEISAGAFVSIPRLQRQRLEIELNKVPIATIILSEAVPRRAVIPLPNGVLAKENRFVFRMPDAASPAGLGLSDDGRVLAIAFAKLRLMNEP